MIGLLVGIVGKAYAQVDCSPGAGGLNLANCLQLSDGQYVRDVYTSPAFLVNLIVRNLFIVAGIVLFFMIMLAGYKFLYKDKGGLEDAKQILFNAVIGFVIMFSAYWVVQLIALITGADIRI